VIAILKQNPIMNETDVLVNNAAEQHVKPSIMDITKEQLERTFRTNIFAHFFLTREWSSTFLCGRGRFDMSIPIEQKTKPEAALPHM